MFSFGIVAEHFEVFENDTFDCKVLWMVGKGEWKSVGFFVLFCWVQYLKYFICNFTFIPHGLIRIHK